MEEEKKETVEQEEQQEEKKEEKSFFDNLGDTEDSTSEINAKDIEENKVMAVLAYIGILILVPLLAAPKSKFAKYHCNQAIFLFLVEIFSVLVCNLLGLIPGAGIVFTILGGVIDLFCFIFMIIGIINAAQGKAKALPLIGNFNIINWKNTEYSEKEESEKEESKEEDKE